MSLSKYRECGILRIPGLLQNLCCLACSLKMIGVDEEVMKHIVAFSLPLTEVSAPRNPELLQMYGHMSPLMKKAIASVCLNLEDLFGFGNVAVTHPGYYQPISTDLECSIQEPPIPIGRMQRGKCLEIFQSEAKSDITASILDHMKSDCTRVIKPAKQYQNLPLIIRDTVITLSISSQEYQVYRKTQSVASSNTHDFPGHHLLIRDLLDQYIRVLNLISKVAMIVVDCTNSDQEDLGIVDLLNRFKVVYGSLDEILVVCIYAYTDFTKMGIDCKIDARKLVNFEGENFFPNLILWLDVSSNMDGISEENGPLDLKIKTLNGK